VTKASERVVKGKMAMVGNLELYFDVFFKMANLPSFNSKIQAIYLVVKKRVAHCTKLFAVPQS
jgi:hypothetical protein